VQLSGADVSAGPAVSSPSGPPPIQAPEDPLSALAGASRQANGNAQQRARGFFISPSTRSRLAIFAGLVMMIVAGINAWSSHLQVQLLERVAVSPAGSVSEYELLSNDARVQAWALAYLAAYVAFLVFFLVWKYRAYKNLKALAAREIRMSPGGSVGWYFCPIANFWKPCQAMNDIWQGSDSATIRPGRGVSGGLVGLWWTVFLLRSFYSQIVGRLSLRADSLEEFISYSWMDVADSCLMAIFVLLTVIIVSSVSARQLQRKRVLDGAATHASPYGVL